jgi:hypothetical protein
LPSGGKGQRFESSRVRQIRKKPTAVYVGFLRFSCRQVRTSAGSTKTSGMF